MSEQIQPYYNKLSRAIIGSLAASILLNGCVSDNKVDGTADSDSIPNVACYGIEAKIIDVDTIAVSVMGHKVEKKNARSPSGGTVTFNFHDGEKSTHLLRQSEPLVISDDPSADKDIDLTLPPMIWSEKISHTFEPGKHVVDASIDVNYTITSSDDKINILPITAPCPNLVITTGE